MNRLQLKIVLLYLGFFPKYLECVTIHDRIDTGNKRFHNEKESILSNQASPIRESETIQAGFVYTDADDVIHIIEPPDHFQEMKRRHRKRHDAASNIFGTRLQQLHKTNLIKTPTKVKEYAPAPAKVDKPEKIARIQQINNRRPSISAGKLIPIASDLVTQETRVRAAAQLPLEILASVRKTEQLKQQKQQRPFVNQRVKTHKTHTVIMERGYEQTRFKHGQESRIGGHKIKSGVTRRAQRLRRDVADTSNTNIDHAQRIADMNIEQGSLLLARLDALLKHAARYIPDDNDTAKHNDLLNELRQRFQHEFEPKQLIGEIEPTTKATFPEQELYHILESSLNATDTIMQELIQRRATSTQSTAYSSSKCSDKKSLDFDGNALQQLKLKIDCMRQQLSAARESTTTTATATLTTVKPVLGSSLNRGNTRFGQRTRYKATTTTTTDLPITKHIPNFLQLRTRAKSLRVTPQNASVRLDALTEARQRFIPHKPRSKTRPTDARNVTTAAAVLLYDDVMTNIRNMLETKNLKLTQVLPESRQTNELAKEEAEFAIDFIEASPSTLSIDAGEDSSYFRDLNRYLSQLQQVVTQLPQTKTQFNGSSYAHSSSSSNNGYRHTDWYLINGEGKISETPFDVQLQPTAVIFHRFPDIPNASIYVHNRNSLAAASPAIPTQSEKTYEIF